MAFQIFTIPIRDAANATADLNAFLQSHQVLTVKQRWVEQGINSFWSFCVDYVEVGNAAGNRRGGARQQRIDYKETLKPEDFAVFAKLRVWRKEQGDAEGVPVYTIFNNEQMAQMVQQRVTTKAAMEKIAGVGDARVEKYGKAVLELLRAAWKDKPEAKKDKPEAKKDKPDAQTHHLFEQIAERDNLRVAVHKALRGKRQRPEAREFCRHLERRLEEMVEQLWAGTFVVGRCRQFVIRDPKERLITAPCFAERVLHHGIMNICEPLLDRWLIADTFACRIARGRLAALQRAGQFARRSPYFLRLDIRKYFDSIPHAVLLDRLARRFKDERLLRLFERIVRGYRGALGQGVPIGSLTSQHFANFYLGWFDRFVKERLRIPGYVRYMDDMVMWGETTVGLQETLRACAGFLEAELHLAFKPAPYLNRTQHGMDFLGCRVFARRLTLNARSRCRFRRKLTSLERQFVAGEVDALQLQQRATSLVACARTPGVTSRRFRSGVLQQRQVSSPGAPAG